MPETVTIDGRGDTIEEAMEEMRQRMQPLEARGFHPISEVEIVDAATKQIIQTFQLTDPESDTLVQNLKTDRDKKKREEDKLHRPEKKEHFRYISRIRLEG